MLSSNSNLDFNTRSFIAISLLLANLNTYALPKVPENSRCEWLNKDANGWIMPYLTKPFLDQLKIWDISNWSVFIWNDGEGITPAWFARKCRKLVCVDYRIEWQQALNAFFQQKRCPHAVCLLGKLERKAAKHPLFGLQEINVMNYLGDQSSYVRAIDQTDELYDCIIIDGLHRNACARAALKHIKPGGILILNNPNQATIGCNSTETFALLKSYQHYSYHQPNHLDWCTDYWVINA